MIKFQRFLREYKKNKSSKVLKISLLFLIWAVAFSIFEYFSPLYLESLNLSFVKIGIILSGYSLISLFIDPILGALQKRFSLKSLLITSVILFLANIFLFINSGNIFLFLFIATNLYGIAYDLFSITCYKGVFDSSKEKNRSLNLSYLESMYSFGLLAGALIAGFLVSKNLMYAPYFSVMLLLFLSVFIISSNKRGNVFMNVEKIKFVEGYKDIYNQIKNSSMPEFFLIFLLIFLHTFDGFFFVFMPIFAQKFHGLFLSEYVIGGILLALYSLPIILLELTFGRLEDRFGRKKFIILGLFVSGLSVYLLQATDNVFASAICIFLLSLGFFGIALPAIEGMYESITEKRFGKRYRGDSVSIMEITLSLGFLFGPIIGGLFLDSSGGFGLAFRIFAIAIGVIILLSAVFLKKEFN